MEIVWVIVVVGVVFYVGRSFFAKVEGKIADQKRVDDGIHYEHESRDGDYETLLRANFDTMVLTCREIIHDFPVIDETTLFHLRRLDGPRWELRLTSESVKVAEAEIESQTLETYKKSMGEDLDRNRDWHAIGDRGPQIETAYQRHIHRP